MEKSQCLCWHKHPVRVLWVRTKVGCHNGVAWWLQAMSHLSASCTRDSTFKEGKKIPRLPTGTTQGSTDALHACKVQERVCQPVKPPQLSVSPCLLSLWGVLMLCMPQRDTQICPSHAHGDPHPDEGVMPAQHPVPFALCGLSLAGAGCGGMGWDGSVLLWPARIAQKLIVPGWKRGAEAV